MGFGRTRPRRAAVVVVGVVLGATASVWLPTPAALAAGSSTAAPVVSQVCPIAGQPGEPVFVRGRGFTGTTEVTFGGVPAPFWGNGGVTDSFVAVFAPPHALGPDDYPLLMAAQGHPAQPGARQQGALRA